MNPALVSNYNSYQPLTISIVNSSNMIPIQNHDLCFCMKSRTFNWLFVIYMDSDKVNQLISCRFTCHVSNERHSVADMFNPHGGAIKKTLFFSKYVYGCILQSWSNDIFVIQRLMAFYAYNLLLVLLPVARCLILCTLSGITKCSINLKAVSILSNQRSVVLSHQRSKISSG